MVKRPPPTTYCFLTVRENFSWHSSLAQIRKKLLVCTPLWSMSILWVSTQSITCIQFLFLKYNTVPFRNTFLIKRSHKCFPNWKCMISLVPTGTFVLKESWQDIMHWSLKLQLSKMTVKVSLKLRLYVNWYGSNLAQIPITHLQRNHAAYISLNLLLSEIFEIFFQHLISITNLLRIHIYWLQKHVHSIYKDFPYSSVSEMKTDYHIACICPWIPCFYRSYKEIIIRVWYVAFGAVAFKIFCAP